MTTDLKAMYKKVHKDAFPETMTILLGDEKLVYHKRVWTLDNEEKGLRYGENPDQPAALYELREGGITCGGLRWRGPGQGIVSAMTEAQMIQAGKHPGKTNLTDVDNGANILQYLSERPAAIILKHNNPCGAAWDDAGVAAALDKAFWCDRIAAFGGAVVVNRPFTREAAEMVAASYFEVVAAPAYEEGAVEILKGRKNLRIMELPGLGRLDELTQSAFLDIKSLADGGIVVQKSFVNRILTDADFLPAEATDKNGVTVTADAVMGDAYNAVIVYTISRDDGTRLLPEDITGEMLLVHGNGTDLSILGGSHGSSYFVVEDPAASSIQMVETVSADKPINDCTATGVFENLYKWDEEAGEAVPIIEGKWRLKFEMTYEDSSVTLSGGETFTQDGMTFTIDSITLSPVAYKVDYTVDSEVVWSNSGSGRQSEEDRLTTQRYFENVEILLTLTDGTVIDLSNAGGSIGPEDGVTVCSKGEVFSEVLPMEDMASISVGGVVYDLTVE